MAGHDIRGYTTIWNSSPPLTIVALSGQTQIVMFFKIDVPATCFGIRAYLPTANANNYWGWFAQDGQSQIVRVCSFDSFQAGSHAPQWSTAFFKRPIKLIANQKYVIVAVMSRFGYGQMVLPHSGDTDTTIGHFTIPADTTSIPNGASNNTLPLFLSTSLGAAKPAIDVLVRI